MKFLAPQAIIQLQPVNEIKEMSIKFELLDLLAYDQNSGSFCKIL